MKSAYFLIIGGIYLLIRAYSNLKHTRNYHSYPISPIRSASMGRVKIKGQLGPIDSSSFLTSPISKTKSLAYVYLVQEYKQSLRGNGFHTLLRQGNWNQFYINDGTDKLLIDPKFISILNKPKVVSKQRFFKRLTPEAEAFCKQKNIPLTSLFGLKRWINVSEYLLEPSQPIEVLGILTTNTEGKKLLTSSDTQNVEFSSGTENLVGELMSSAQFLLGVGLIALGVVAFIFKLT